MVCSIELSLPIVDPIGKCRRVLSQAEILRGVVRIVYSESSLGIIRLCCTPCCYDFGLDGNGGARLGGWQLQISSVGVVYENDIELGFLVLCTCMKFLKWWP